VAEVPDVAEPAPSGPPRRVVVGVDGSPGARAALAWAIGEAVRRRAELDVLTAVPLGLYWTDAYLPDPARIPAELDQAAAAARAQVTAVCRDAGPDPAATRPVVRVVAVAGSPGPRLVERAAGAGLLVVGSRGRGVVRSAVLGSVALHCATHSPCPVAVVHEQRDAARPAPTVVVGLDGSEPARLALRTARAQAARLGGELIAVVAYGPPPVGSDPAVATLGGETAEQARRRGTRLVGEVLETAGPGPRIRVVTEPGPVAEALVRWSDGAALLVVGSRTRHQLAGLVLGSVALHCVVAASCPVMVVRTAGTRSAPAATAPRATASAGGRRPVGC
jgi:nucleotide-binding universal stress UspA family protein